LDELAVKSFSQPFPHQYLSQGKRKMLKKGSIVLSIWWVINFILTLIILCYVIVLKKDSPILQVASFSEAEIASLGARTMAALNSFTILYNSCSLMISVLTWSLIRRNLVAGQKSAFWMLVFVIGFIEVMAFLASAYFGNGRWQVNVVQSCLYLTGIGMSGYSIFTGVKNEFNQ
jgi:uncharacterized membrane protein YhaH (DUF805 family)